ncbi:TMEM175 family protein [Sphingobium nicotianae]|uniref:DUF1211 domain-containing protein n=1 Tax=Sphingobium nicotianae TaxID=2782607 RepID=A0A9X1IS52_9SPHN|nr:TMEM175 family protein [Sphingobium nicotianae]MBT2188176.1 DUF1211 domain-containing protein [Sphingobium nicotianae]
MSAGGKNGTAVNDHRLERLIFFSDAVIAIAITLLIIEIHPPHLQAGQNAWHALAELGPEFFGFALSFAVIGRFWVGHHSALGTMTAYDPRVLVPNMAFLMVIAFMPFATGFLSLNLGEEVPAIFYNVTLTALAVLNAWVIFVATDQAHEKGTPFPPHLRDLRARALSVIIASLLAVALAFVIPAISQIALFTIPLWRALLARLRSVAT